MSTTLQTKSADMLNQSVTKARQTAAKILQPLSSSAELLTAGSQVDFDKRFVNVDRLTGFNPFAGNEYPFPASENPGVEVAEQTYSPEGFNQSVVLNQGFLQLVNEVERIIQQPPSGNTVSSKSAMAKGLNKTLGSKSDSIAKPMNHAVRGKDMAELKSNDDANKSNVGSQTPSEWDGKTHSVFMQLETLVSELSREMTDDVSVVAEKDKQGGEKLRGIQQENKSFKDNQGSHLEKLTTSLLKTNLIKTQLEESNYIAKGNSKKEATDGKENVKSSSRNMGTQPSIINPGIKDQVHQSAIGRNNPDIINRTPNLEISEGTSRSAHFDMVSPMASQAIADALNDYLHEQAELHGVDLS